MIRRSNRPPLSPGWAHTAAWLSFRWMAQIFLPVKQLQYASGHINIIGISKGIRKHEVIRNCQRSKANLFNILLLSPLFTHETAVLHVFMIRLTGSVRNFPIIYGISEKLAYNIRSDMTVNKQCCGGSYSYYQAVSQEYKHSLCLWIGKLLG